MEWKFSKENLHISDIEKIEKLLSIKLPKEFKEIISNYNGARPSLISFDIENEKEKVFDALIDYNPNSKNNVIELFNRIKRISDNKIIPFGEDGFGNYICFQYHNTENPQIVFFNHENNKIKYIAESFNNFLKILY